ncbi:MAG: hypothetical protein OER90_03430 [Gemmatimonadota bacterium]|nr:hypothetical protein [Gemmatimonadota bacterium]
MRPTIIGLALAVAISACGENGVEPLPLETPQNLGYELEASGDPDAPLGLLLFWDQVDNANLAVYRVYSRPSANANFGLRGETTSITFHDNGIPDLEYFVVAVDLNGFESEASNSVVIDERLRLDPVQSLVGTSLNGAVYLTWSDNPFQTSPNAFKQYRVYSAPYDLDAGACDDAWGLEGTTVAPEFVVAALNNGEPVCFAISAESIEGYESLWSPTWADTPRPDARNVLMTAREADAATAGFRFWLDNGDGIVAPAELGVVAAESNPEIDFFVRRDAGGNFFMVPVRAGTEVLQYSQGPVDDLTSIDIAPETGYSTAEIQAQPRFGYVFQMDGGDGFARFGAIRVTHVGQDVMIFDWSFQTDPGNPELAIGAGVFNAAPQGVVVRR